MPISQKLRGFVGQNMAGKKRLVTAFIGYKDSALGDSSFTATKTCWAFVLAWGGGGSGANTTGSPLGGGAGGAAGFKRVRLFKGQTISWSVGAGAVGVGPGFLNGNPGGDTVVTTPSGALTAGGGQGGSSVDAVGGLATGTWDVARQGGSGSASGANGGSPSGGGTGGSGGGGYGGGGASAGFSDLFSGGTYAGNGGGGNSTAGGGAPGGASGATLNSTSGAGGAGRVAVYIFAANA